MAARLIADGTSRRDIQSARSFADGFFPAECADARKAAIVAPTEEVLPGLLPVVSDEAELGCSGPTEHDLRLTFGGQFDALTAAYDRQIRRVGEILGCCSPRVCAVHGPAERACELSELRYEYTGHFWSYFDGPLAVAGYYADAWMLQALSGLEPFAWGNNT